MSVRETTQKQIDFINDVNRIVFLVDPPSIDKFSLCISKITDIFHINKWISASVARNVKDLELCLPVYHIKPVELPMSLFYCKTLEDLKLTCGIAFNIPKEGSVCFPNLKVLYLFNVDCGEIPDSFCFPLLKTLRLNRVKYVKNDSVSKLVCKCPVLEDFVIIRTAYDNLVNIDMCTPALKRAEFDFDHNIFKCKVQIDAPMLQYLKIVDWRPSQEVLIKEPDSLMEANLFNYVGCDYLPVQQAYMAFNLIKVVDKVKCLSVSYTIVNAITAFISMLPLFCNLTRLDLALRFKDWSVLQSFLNNSINLQHLVIQKVSPPCGVEGMPWTDIVPVPKCLLTSLRRVEIRYLKECSYDEVAMIKYMLKSAKILEKLTIQTKLRENVYRKNEILLKISMFPRLSTACEFEIS